MADRRLLYGFLAGLISYGVFSNRKGSLRPLAVKAVRGALIFSDKTKEIIEDVTAEAKEKHKAHLKKMVEKNQKMELETLEHSANEQPEADIAELKRHLNELQEQLRQLSDHQIEDHQE